MGHLASCYFCGGALDRPLQTYNLPTQTQPESPTITLCSACSEKLDTIFDAVGTGSLTRATEREDEGATADNIGSQQGNDDHSTKTGVPSESTATESDVSQRSSDGDKPVKEATEGDERDGFSENDDPFSDDKFEDDDLSGETTAGALDGEEDPLGSETGGDTGSGTFDAQEGDEEPDVTEVTINVSGADRDSSPAARASETDDEPDAESSDDHSGTGLEKHSSTGPEKGHSAKGGEEEDSKDTPQTDEEPSEPQTQSRTTVTALEYNKVMRMLQNREFPVEREKIEVVAANAYELDPSHCAQVIDLAIDRGLLDERDGNLYRPDS